MLRPQWEAGREYSDSELAAAWEEYFKAHLPIHIQQEGVKLKRRSLIRERISELVSIGVLNQRKGSKLIKVMRRPDPAQSNNFRSAGYAGDPNGEVWQRTASWEEEVQQPYVYYLKDDIESAENSEFLAVVPRSPEQPQPEKKQLSKEFLKSHRAYKELPESWQSIAIKIYNYVDSRTLFFDFSQLDGNTAEFRKLNTTIKKIREVVAPDMAESTFCGQVWNRIKKAICMAAEDQNQPGGYAADLAKMIKT